MRRHVWFAGYPPLHLTERTCHFAPAAPPPGPAPGIHVLAALRRKNVDGRDVGERKRCRPFGRLGPITTRCLAPATRHAARMLPRNLPVSVSSCSDCEVSWAAAFKTRVAA